MNKDRRKAIAALIDQIREIGGKVEDIRTEIETLREDEQEYFDNMPERFQSGEKGEISESAIREMEEVISTLEEMRFDDAASSLDNAAA